MFSLLHSIASSVVVFGEKKLTFKLAQNWSDKRKCAFCVCVLSPQFFSDAKHTIETYTHNQTKDILLFFYSIQFYSNS